MTPDQIKLFKEEMKDHIEEVIKKTVNGKIDALSMKVDPVVTFYQNLTFMDKAFRWGFGLVITIGAVVGIAAATIKWIRQ